MHQSGWAECVQLSMVWRGVLHQDLTVTLFQGRVDGSPFSHTFLLEISLPSAVTDAHVVTRATYAGWWSPDTQIQPDHLQKNRVDRSDLRTRNLIRLQSEESLVPVSYVWLYTTSKHICTVSFLPSPAEHPCISWAVWYMFVVGLPIHEGNRKKNAILRLLFRDSFFFSLQVLVFVPRCSHLAAFSKCGWALIKNRKFQPSNLAELRFFF